jgi:peptidoglycan/LPS O-acetylase OafA/YrhL
VAAGRGATGQLAPRCGDAWRSVGRRPACSDWADAVFITLALPARFPQMEPDRPPAAFYHPELDTLRFFAFLMVFALHALPTRVDYYAAFMPPELARWAAAGITAGAFGVDLFFALSSYLITELLIREVRTTGRLDVVAFYVRRTLRIWPLYFTVFALCTFVVPRFLPVPGLENKYLLSFMTFLGNWSCAAYGLPHAPVFPLWSVSVEEQFYVTWPLLLLVFGVRRVALLAVVVLVAAQVVRVYLVSRGVRGDGIWCNTFARMDAFACGALLAVVLKGRAPDLAPLVRRLLIGAAAVAWVVSACFGGRDQEASVVGLPVAALAATAVLVASIRPSAAGGKALPYLGKISYGLYSFHILALMIAGLVTGQGGAGRNMVRIGIGFSLTLAFAVVSYHLLERPFLRLKRRFTHVRSRPDVSL